MLKVDEAQTLPISSFVCHSQGLSVPHGEVHGNCIVCTRTTEDGHRVRLPDTFTSWEFFQEGTNICPECRHMLDTEEYRRTSWLATTDEFRTLKTPDVRQILTDIPRPPWALYITLSFRKHGWLRTDVNLSRTRFVLTADMDRYPVTDALLKSTVTHLRAVTKYIDRWWWLQDSIGVPQQARLALADAEEYEWFRAHQHDSLTRLLLHIMIPTKKELKEQQEDEGTDESTR